MVLQTLFTIAFPITIIGIVTMVIINKIKDRKKILDKIKNTVDQTDELKISSRSYRSFPIDFGNTFTYCKFYFTGDEVFLIGSNNYPRNIYTNFFVLKHSPGSQYSYFSKFSITKFQITGNDLKIQFKNENIVGTKMTLNIADVSEKDKSVLTKHISVSADMSINII